MKSRIANWLRWWFLGWKWVPCHGACNMPNCPVLIRVERGSPLLAYVAVGLKRLLPSLVLLVAVAQVHAQYVTLTGTIQTSNGLPSVNDTMAFTPTQWGFVAGTGVVVNTTTYCATSIDGTAVGITNPLTKTTNTPAYGTGTLPAANYYVEYSWYVAGSPIRETLLSPESTAQLTSTGNLTIAPPAGPLPAGVTGMKVYIGTTCGGESYQGLTTGTNVYVQSSPLSTGGLTPSSNSTICQQVANDAIWPVGTGYTVSLTDPSGNTLPGYPMIWQLLGPNSTINLSNGLPYYHGIVTFPVPILASPLNHTGQSISGSLSLGSYTLYSGLINSTGGYKVGSNGGTVGTCLASDGTAFDTILACGANYQTVQVAGVSQTQEARLNFISGFTVADNPSNHSTDVSLTAPKVQLALPATTVNANTCSSVSTVTFTGVGPTSTFSTSFATSPVAAVGWGANGGLVVELWPDALPGVLDWDVCNQTSSSITPTAITLNVGLN